jgi:ArsR family transcriptional regulator
MPALTSLDRRVVARCCHALSDETRVKILDRLSTGERCVCELTAALAAAQPRLSFHLKTLKDAGLINDRREGRWVYYSINQEALAEVHELLERLAAPVRHPLRVLTGRW